MKHYLNILTQCSLFVGLDEAQILSALQCVCARIEKVSKGEDIFLKRGASMGILLAGNLQTLSFDYQGNQNIIASFVPSDLFGESFVCANVQTVPITLLATEESVVMFLDYNKIIGVCNHACVFHLLLIKNMLMVLAKKNILLNCKIQHITHRTTKEKILSYLMEQSRFANSKIFSIPFNRQELADYLSVERSALSAQLSKLRQQGVIRFNKNEFELMSSF
ncbi:MAG: Crp/Fnr family transcriptional regulator [Treponemataceae bacterium]